VFDYVPGVNERWSASSARLPNRLAIGLAAALSTLGCAKLRPATLECHIQYADTLQTHVVGATSNPYAVPSLDVEGRFEFRAVYVTEPTDLAGLNIYVYQTGTPTHALIHQLKLQPPYGTSGKRRFGITGLHLLYDERAREVQYWCGFADTEVAR
jgi:hypothetical protein